MPCSDDRQDHVMRCGQDGLTDHFKKSKPLKPTSHTIVNSRVEYHVSTMSSTGYRTFLTIL